MHAQEDFEDAINLHRDKLEKRRQKELARLFKVPDEDVRELSASRRKLLLSPLINVDSWTGVWFGCSLDAITNPFLAAEARNLGLADAVLCRRKVAGSFHKSRKRLHHRKESLFQ